MKEYDSFYDDDGKRIGKYVEDLKSILDEGSIKDALDYANKCYSKNWGEDKILKTINLIMKKIFISGATGLLVLI